MSSRQIFPEARQSRKSMIPRCRTHCLKIVSRKILARPIYVDPRRTYLSALSSFLPGEWGGEGLKWERVSLWSHDTCLIYIPCFVRTVHCPYQDDFHSINAPLYGGIVAYLLLYFTNPLLLHSQNINRQQRSLLQVARPEACPRTRPLASLISA